MTDPREHWCEAAGCRERGSHGYAVGKDKPLLWYCAAHQHLGDARLAPATAVEPGPEPVPVSPGQGRLL